MKHEELIYAKSFFFLVLFRKKNAIIVYKILEDISMSKLQ